MNVMKFSICVVGLAAISSAFAQNSPVPVRHLNGVRRVHATSPALETLEADLSSARAAMTSALPIYEGHRAHSIEMTHRAIRIIDREEGDAFSPVRDHVHHTRAHSKYSNDQISASQGQMNQGLQALNQALTDLNAVANGSNGRGAQSMAKLIQAAISQAQTAIALYAHP